MEDSPLQNISPHRHNGVDSLKVSVNDLEDAYTGADAVKLTGDQTVAGIKTFSSIPVLPASNPTTDNQAVRKAYVDARFAATEVYATDTLRDSANTDRTTDSDIYIKVKEIQFNDVSGTIRTKIICQAAKADPDSYVRIYKNGVAYGTEHSFATSVQQTFSEDLAFVTGDLIQLYYKQTSADPTATLTIQNFELYYDKRFTITAGTVISN